MDEEKLKIEKRYLKIVVEVLKKQITEYQESIDKSKKMINEEKRFMWENLNDYTDEERMLALSDVDKNVNVTNMQINRTSKLEKSLDSPYFGKIVFLKSNSNKAIDVYIGLSSIQDNSKFYVFDWRSPIASLFYNFELGEAFYNAPVGQISGDVLSKMQFKIVDSKLLRCFNSDINIDDEFLQEILANNSSNKMKNIVSTIQREQNLIIRNVSDKNLIVQGAAGSGKTSVALHRIAFLLYKNTNLNSNNVLIFSPNDVFSDYISNILPELGEDNVLKTTFADFSKTFLQHVKSIENYSEFLERIYSSNDINDSNIKYKMSNLYEQDLDKYFKNYIESINFNQDFTIGEYNIKAEEVNYLFNCKYRNFSIKERLDEISEYICIKYHLPIKKLKNKICRFIIDKYKINFNLFDIYSNFLLAMGYNNNIFRKSKKINYEDISGLIFIYFKLYGYPNFLHIKQVVIDEVQDYTPLQLNLIKKIFRNASFTILGDVNQTINPYHSYSSLNELSVLFDSSRYIELNKTYRSSKEIIEYTNRILGINNICSVRNDNNIYVDIVEAEDELICEKLKYDLIRLKENNYNKIALITKDKDYAIKLYEGLLKLNVNSQLIISADDLIKNKIIIIPSYLSKGLEFDAVIACNEIENNYDETSSKLYYVVCTRAQHSLKIYNEPKKLIKSNIVRR